MRKLLCAVVVAMIGLSAFGSSSFAASPIKVFVYNKQIKTDSAPFIEKDTVLVPLRAVAESLEATVSWDSKKNAVSIRKWSETIVLTVGQRSGLLLGKPQVFGDSIILSVPVQLIKGRIYVPLRFVSEQYGYRVEWENNTVYIDSPFDADAHATLYEGDLQAARELIINKPLSEIHYSDKPLEGIEDDEHISSTYLFPEGETLRFYLIRNGTISLVEIKDDFFIITWQASIGQGDGLKQFIEKKFKDERGTAQKIEKSFVYYSTGFLGDSSHESSGIIDLVGKITVTGHKSMIDGKVSQEVGTIGLKQSEEIRTVGLEK
ncbi:copper amine oxidase N-terminal domain-containing protein [Cohnella sp.]|uniref:copper amine oxidase N-terminal domain-containing protein n=1 Tax=Cohnella sp. TaxID=1883426 RepID=UPI003561CDB2